MQFTNAAASFSDPTCTKSFKAERYPASVIEVQDQSFSMIGKHCIKLSFCTNAKCTRYFVNNSHHSGWSHCFLLFLSVLVVIFLVVWKGMLLFHIYELLRPAKWNSLIKTLLILNSYGAEVYSLFNIPHPNGILTHISLLIYKTVRVIGPQLPGCTN